MTIDPDLGPSDAVVALRSLPRRYRAALAAVQAQDDPDEIALRRGADGWTAIGHVVAASRAVGGAARALEEVLRSDEPVVERAVVDANRRVEDPAPGGTIEERVSELGWESDALAETADRVSARDWARAAKVPDRADPVTALDVLRAAVEAGIDHLRAMEATLVEVRGRPS
ncbi:MAG: hypothetical protein AB7L84_00380 [Acidimicrobiia bacterium]